MRDQRDLIHNDLLSTKHRLYKPCNLNISALEAEAEGSEYGACFFTINDFNVRFRVAKITPKKIGQFVTLWKRVGDGPTQPYDANDDVDFFVISTRCDKNFGQFIFPKSALIKNNVFSLNGSGGKRGIRVYPPWDQAENAQAKKTQKWQLQYFLDLTSVFLIDFERARLLYTVLS